MRKYAIYAAMRRPRIGADLVVVSRGRLSLSGSSSLSVARAAAAAAPFKSSDRHDSAADHRLPTVDLLLSSEQYSVDQRPSPAALGLVVAHRSLDDHQQHPDQQFLLRPARVESKCSKSASNRLIACLLTTTLCR